MIEIKGVNQLKETIIHRSSNIFRILIVILTKTVIVTTNHLIEHF